MRPPGIHISGGRPRSVEEFLDRVQGRGRKAAAPSKAKPKLRFLGSDGRELERPGIQGFATIFDTTFRHDGGYVFFQQGCMHDIYAGGKKLLLDHKESKEVGSTAFGLEFANTCSANPVNGLAFRMPLSEDNPNSQLIYDTVTKLKRPCLSVGINVEESEVITVHQTDVKVVMKASLREVSLVPEGAVPGTNACIVDLADEEPWLLMAARSRRFVGDKYAANVQASAQRIVERIKELTR